MNEQFTPELLTQARGAETPEALLALAKEHGVTLTPEEAQAHFDQLHQTGAVSDEELDNVAGGCGSEPKAKFSVGTVVSPFRGGSNWRLYWYCPICEGPPNYALCHYARVKKNEYYEGNWYYTLECATHQCPVGKVTNQNALVPETHLESAW